MAAVLSILEHVPVQAWVGAAAISLLWTLEWIAPLVAHSRDRAAHSVRNLAIGAIGAGLRSLLFPTALLAVSEWSRREAIGLFHRHDWPFAVTLILGVVALDGWAYLWHILSHKVPFLWRFHLVHHHDESVDASTAFRFHAGDVLLTSAATLAIVPVLGLSVWHVLAYEALVLPLSAFHHANLAIPERADRVMRLLIVTPRMHRVHHSRWQPETDSDYAAIFSFWDRLFGTYRVRSDPASMSVGLDGYEPKEHASVAGCLRTPFGPIKSGPGHAPADEPPSRTLGACPRRRLPKPAHG